MRRIFISLLTTSVVMSMMMLNSCSGVSIDLPVQEEHKQEEPENQTPDEPSPEGPSTPDLREGSLMTVTMGGDTYQLFPSDCESIMEIPFTLSPVVESLLYEVKVTVPSVVSTDVIMSEDNTGGVIKVCTTGNLSTLCLTLRVTETGENVLSNWCESEKVNLEPYSLVLSHHERETQPSGTDHGEFRVISNVGFDPIVDDDCCDWISIVGVEDEEWVVIDIKENTTNKVREGHIRVWDSGHHVYETFTVIQKCPSVYDNDGDGFFVEVEDIIDGGDHHIIY